MTRDQVVHDAMRIVHRGQAITLANNTFHRMARIDLLRTLREHCSALGVAIEFGRKVDDVAEFDDCDLVVAADGAASAIRTRYREHFEPVLDVRPNLLAWYGTTAPFDPLSLIFRENDDGLLIAHAYRYSATHSTFLVECDPRTWHAAGLDRMPEAESLAYCERAFRDDLDGRPLLSNRSEWFRYAIVSNRRWHWRNLVLLRRCAAHRPSLGRLGHAARDAGCDRAVRGVRRAARRAGAACRIRAPAAAGFRCAAERRDQEHAVVRDGPYAPLARSGVVRL